MQGLLDWSGESSAQHMMKDDDVEYICEFQTAAKIYEGESPRGNVIDDWKGINPTACVTRHTKVKPPSPRFVQRRVR